MVTENDYSVVVHDLIEINNDRILGYEKAAEQTPELDLKALFSKMAEESRGYKKQLQDYAAPVGAIEDEDATTNSGKLYRTWMDVKANFGGDSRKSLLNSCEFGEDAIQKAYDSALKEIEYSESPELRDLVGHQKMALRKSHDQVKALRDAPNNSL